MVAYSFRPRFIDPILAGLEPGPLLPGMKRQTIRGASGGKRHARPGELVQLYTGMRTRQCRKLGEGRCVAAEPVTLLVKAGKFKAEGNPYEPLTEEAQAAMQARVNDYYDMFVKAVARGRGVKPADVRNGFGEGRVVGAAEAVRLGMADRVATFEDTLARMRNARPSGQSRRSLAFA
ncbi:S49 family peptidase [Azospirillum argentinense]